MGCAWVQPQYQCLDPTNEGKNKTSSVSTYVVLADDISWFDPWHLAILSQLGVNPSGSMWEKVHWLCLKAHLTPKAGGPTPGRGTYTRS